jgi:hypothetical protein
MTLRLLLPLLFSLLSVSAFAGQREETFEFEGRRFTIPIPRGFTCDTVRPNAGEVTVRLTKPKEGLSLQLTVLPDPERFFTPARARKEFLADKFHSFAEKSVEKAMCFEEFTSRNTAGTYCVFTDSRLFGKTELPDGEYRHATTGIKVWPGCVAVFMLLSNDTTSKSYTTLFRVATDGLCEKKASAPALH